MDASEVARPERADQTADRAGRETRLELTGTAEPVQAAAWL